mmetsp:Transcript_76607/g.194393  ORF Transcript_76607/g.194393 Transcript_76607/m.194393 type:complete len:365 (-) Transcript_76607:186-1280(-)
MTVCAVPISFTTDQSRIELDNHVPVLHLAISLKIPIDKLIAALATFQSEHDEWPAGPVPKQQTKAIAPQPVPMNMGGDGAKAPPLDLRQALVVPTVGPPSEAGAGAGVAPLTTAALTAHTREMAQRPVPPVPAVLPLHLPTPLVAPPQEQRSWDTEILDLQPSYAAYGEHTKWQTLESRQCWKLDVDSAAALTNYEPKPIDVPRWGRPRERVSEAALLAANSASALSAPGLGWPGGLPGGPGAGVGATPGPEPDAGGSLSLAGMQPHTAQGQGGNTQQVAGFFTARANVLGQDGQVGGQPGLQALPAGAMPTAGPAGALAAGAPPGVPAGPGPPPGLNVPPGVAAAPNAAGGEAAPSGVFGGLR